jgi:hypothetical protein
MEAPRRCDAGVASILSPAVQQTEETFMKSILSVCVVALTQLGFVSLVHADTCTALAGKTQCVKFRFSNGGDKTSTAIFGADGSLTLPDATGTYKCAGGLGLFEANYKDGAGEKQRWYATAGSGGNHVSGNGKSLSAGYMYILSSTVGACAADDASRAE